MPRATMSGAAWVIDAVHTPVDTQFLQVAAVQGLQVISGCALFFGRGVDAWHIFSGTFADKPEAIARAGFDGIEIFEQDFIASDFTPADVGRMVRDAGLEITLFQPFRDFEGLPEPHRTRAFARAARKFDLMNHLGTDLVLVCSSVHPAAMGGIDRMAADFAALGDLAKTHGIRVRFEGWPGAATSTTTATHGRWCAAPITPMSG